MQDEANIRKSISIIVHGGQQQCPCEEEEYQEHTEPCKDQFIYQWMKFYLVEWTMSESNLALSYAWGQGPNLKQNSPTSAAFSNRTRQKRSCRKSARSSRTPFRLVKYWPCLRLWRNSQAKTSERGRCSLCLQRNYFDLSESSTLVVSGNNAACSFTKLRVVVFKDRHGRPVRLKAPVQAKWIVIPKLAISWAGITHFVTKCP